MQTTSIQLLYCPSLPPSLRLLKLTCHVPWWSTPYEKLWSSWTLYYTPTSRKAVFQMKSVNRNLQTHTAQNTLKTHSYDQNTSVRPYSCRNVGAMFLHTLIRPLIGREKNTQLWWCVLIRIHSHPPKSMNLLWFAKKPPSNSSALLRDLWTCAETAPQGALWSPDLPAKLSASQWGNT